MKEEKKEIKKERKGLRKDDGERKKKGRERTNVKGEEEEEEFDKFIDFLTVLNLQ